jgi:hypothetical protein
VRESVRARVMCSVLPACVRSRTSSTRRGLGHYRFLDFSFSRVPSVVIRSGVIRSGVIRSGVIRAVLVGT